jgi:hypothetical protein
MPVVERNEDQSQGGSQQNPLNSAQQNPLNSAQQPQQNQAQQQQQAPVTNRAESANVQAGTPAAQPQQAGAPKPQSQRSSGRFTNLQNFIRANQTPEGAFGQRFAQKVGVKTQQAGQQVDQSKEQFGQQLEDQRQRQLQAGQQAQAGLAQLTQKQEQPTNVAEAAEQVRQATQQEFQAPEELGNLSEIERSRQDAQAISNAAQTETGRFGALQQLFGRQGYSRGQQRLDNLLVGQSGPEAARALQKTATEARGLDSRINRELEESRRQSGQVSGELETQRADLRRQVIEGLGTRGTQLDREIEARNTELEADAAEISQDEFNQLLSGQFGDVSAINRLRGLGLTDDQIRLGFAQNVQKASRANFDRTAAEQLNALANLAGEGEQIQFQDQGPGVQRGLSDSFTQQLALAEQNLAGLQGGANFEDYVRTGEPFQRDAIVNLFNQSPETANLIASIPASGVANQQQREAVINILDPLAKERFTRREKEISDLRKKQKNDDGFSDSGQFTNVDQNRLFNLIDEQNRVFADARNSTLRNLDQINRNQQRRDIISRIGRQ